MGLSHVEVFFQSQSPVLSMYLIHRDSTRSSHKLNVILGGNNYSPNVSCLDLGLDVVLVWLDPAADTCLLCHCLLSILLSGLPSRDMGISPVNGSVSRVHICSRLIHLQAIAVHTVLSTFTMQTTSRTFAIVLWSKHRTDDGCNGVRVCSPFIVNMAEYVTT